MASASPARSFISLLLAAITMLLALASYHSSSLGRQTGYAAQPVLKEIKRVDTEVQLSTKLVKQRKKNSSVGVYHDWKLFESDYKRMIREFRIFVYPEAFNGSSPFANVFAAHPSPYNPKLGNYFSEHMFKINLLNSRLLTQNPKEAHFFFLPFSVNVMRYDPRIRNDGRIPQFIADYVGEISRKFKFWNRTQGADHFYASCHSVGRDAASRSPALQKNAIQVTCSASYFQRLYVPHKDIPLPQVWPRSDTSRINPPSRRKTLAFYAGRTQNSRCRSQLVKLYSQDPDMRVYDGSVQGSYTGALSSSKFCLHVKGYEVNTARISDAIQFGCVPVIISDYYDLPLSNILNWKSFSVIVRDADIPRLKSILQNITDEQYASLHSALAQVKKHFAWYTSPRQYDSFHMTMYQLWLKRHLLRPALS